MKYFAVVSAFIKGTIMYIQYYIWKDNTGVYYNYQAVFSNSSDGQVISINNSISLTCIFELMIRQMFEQECNFTACYIHNCLHYYH